MSSKRSPILVVGSCEDQTHLAAVYGCNSPVVSGNRHLDDHRFLPQGIGHLTREKLARIAPTGVVAVVTRESRQRLLDKLAELNLRHDHVVEVPHDRPVTVQAELVSSTLIAHFFRA